MLGTIISNIKIIYRKTTVLEGTLHLIRGGFKMMSVLILSAYWRHNFKKAGKNLMIFPKTTIEFPKTISVGSNFSINTGSYIRNENINGFLKAKNNVAIGMQVMMDCSGGITLGSEINISNQAHIHTHDHGLSHKNKPKYKRLNIGNDCWLGEGCLILPQVSNIGEGSIVAARAVVTKDVPAHTVVGGNPAKVIRQLN